MAKRGRKLGISRSEQLFRAEFATALSAVIGKDRGAPSRAADKLGVSRQAMSLYLGRKATPNSSILSKAFMVWPKLNLNVEGIPLNSNSFKVPQPQSASPVQMLLFDAISEVEDRQLNVRVLKKGVHSIELKVSIDFKNESVLAVG
jgi:hypothetical protein